MQLTSTLVRSAILLPRARDEDRQFVVFPRPRVQTISGSYQSFICHTVLVLANSSNTRYDSIHRGKPEFTIVAEEHFTNKRRVARTHPFVTLHDVPDRDERAAALHPPRLLALAPTISKTQVVRHHSIAPSADRDILCFSTHTLRYLPVIRHFHNQGTYCSHRLLP